MLVTESPSVGIIHTGIKNCRAVSTRTSLPALKTGSRSTGGRKAATAGSKDAVRPELPHLFFGFRASLCFRGYRIARYGKLCYASGVIANAFKGGVMALLGNFIWFVFGGVFAGLAWALTGCIAFITVVGIPWGRACFMLSNFSEESFERKETGKPTGKSLSGNDDIGTGVLGTLGNIVWFLLFGWALALSHVFFGLLCCCTIIGIPFGVQHFKLAGAALFPVGKTVVDKHLAMAVKTKNAEEKLSSMRAAS